MIRNTEINMSIIHIIDHIPEKGNSSLSEVLFIFCYYTLMLVRQFTAKPNGPQLSGGQISETGTSCSDLVL